MDVRLICYIWVCLVANQLAATTPSADCGSLHTYIRQRLKVFMECQNKTCCCECYQRRPLFTTLWKPDHCSSQLADMVMKANKKCQNQSMAVGKCQKQRYRKYFVIKESHVLNEIEDFRPEDIRVVSSDMNWRWLSVFMMATVMSSLFVVIYLTKSLLDSEVKKPLNAIHDPKRRTEPNIYAYI